jgi:uncharacterized ParB-like nuclease family protein
VKKINLNVIRIDGGTQSRVEINNDAVADYAEAIKAGVEFPPIVVFHDGADHWLADGFHRFHAHKHAGKASILADVRDGTVRDALLHSLGANGTHGLRRSNADKRKAVLGMLADSEWSAWSDRKIAEFCGVSQPFVSGLRKPEVITVITPAPKKEAGKVVTVTANVPKKEAEKVITVITPTPTIEPEKLAEAQEAVQILSEENERLNDRLAVEAMDATEEEKGAAKETIESLRAQVKTLTAELSAVKASRDAYMRDCSEMQRQIKAQRRELDKLKKVEA